MSANRKLTAEVLSTLKKVEEGVLVFDDIWAKVYAAGQQSLKEKYEGDLKKEIKKLQRLRDQIKVWIGSSEIKDKSQLIEGRKIIELKMELFKVCEKDTKTKAYSKEGLARETRLDPREVDKEDKINWLNENMGKLNDLIDSLEADLEKLGKGKGKNKEQTDNLMKRIKKYKWHVLRLDTLIKLIDNDDLEPSKIDSIKDDVEYFIENAAEDDSALGIDDEFDIYEELQLDSIPVTLKNLDAGDGEEDVCEDEDGDGKSAAMKKGAIAPTPIANIGKPLPAKPAPVTPLVKSLAQPTPKLPGNQPMSAAIAGGEKKPLASTATKSPSPSVPSAGGNMAQIPPSQPLPQPRHLEDKGEAPPLTSWASAATQRTAAAAVQNVKPTAPVPQPTQPQQQLLPVQQQQQQHSMGAPPPLSEGPPASLPLRMAGPAQTTRIEPPSEPLQAAPQQSQSASGDVKYGAINPEIMIAINMLKQSMLYCPLGPEADKPPYAPRNAYPTHPSFPTQPPSIIDSPALFEKLPMDTLFLAFYHQQGLHQQVLAAKQLKKQSWRFHKKYMTWFQRHEEPKRTEHNFEEGTYVYFDYESGWCQRIKSEFKFEYAFLEDEF